MAATELMTWVSGSKRWTKKYRGKMYAVSCRQLDKPATKNASRSAANSWWIIKQGELETKRALETHKKLHLNMAYLNGFTAQLQENNPDSPLKPHIQWLPQGEEPVPVETKPAVEGEQIGGWVTQWLEKQQGRIGKGAGYISSERYSAYMHCLHYFRDWVGEKKSIENIDAMLMEKWQTHLMGEIAKRDRDPDKKAGIENSYAKARMQTSIQFIKWLYSIEKIDLPRNLDQLKIPLKSTTPVPASVPDVRMLLDHATERLKLFLLLMLNCGMYQSDVADLEHSQVDWQTGRITRKRSKTQNHERVPVVSYKLWKETFDLLKKYRSDDPKLVLVNNDGGQLVRKWFDEETKKTKKVCNITTAYKRLLGRKDVKLPKVNLGKLRKTSADLIANEKEFARFEELFLGHSPRSVAEKFYSGRNENTLDHAIDWLHGQILG